MTCIIGWVDDGHVWMGGDSAGVAGLDLAVRADEKVFRNGEMLFGFMSSYRMGQVLRYAFKVPDHDPRVPVEKFLVTTFIDAVRTCLKAHGFAKKENDVESGGTFLVGYRGRIAMVGDDYQVGFSLDGFDAVGCGYQVALGAMHAATHLRGQDRVLAALQAAQRFSAGVRAPFHVLSMPAPPPPDDPADREPGVIA